VCVCERAAPKQTRSKAHLWPCRATLSGSLGCPFSFRHGPFYRSSPEKRIER